MLFSNRFFYKGFSLDIVEQWNRLDERWNRLESHLSKDYQIGPLTLRIYFGKSLEKLTRALSHLEKERSEADFTICLWDSSKKENKLPLLDWPFLMAIPYRGYREGPLSLHWFESTETLSFIHTVQKRAYHVVRNPDTLPWWVEGAPLQAILQAWLQNEGLQLAHSAAIGNEREALLLIGKGGSGKSTTTLSCLQAGWSYIGEDYSILDGQTAWSIYHSAKWTLQTRKLFPQFESHIVNQPKDEKALLFYRDLFPDQIKLSLPVRAIVSLTVGTETLPKYEPCDAAIATQHLMMSSLKQLPFCDSQTVQFFKKMGLALPSYRLILGRDLSANGALLSELLR